MKNKKSIKRMASIFNKYPVLAKYVKAKINNEELDDETKKEFIKHADVINAEKITFDKNHENKYTDWQGNKFKDGDTLVKVSLKHTLIGELRDWNGKLIATIPDEFYWNIIGEYKVSKKRNRLFYTIDMGKGGALLLSLTPLFPDENKIYCIKGISDNEEMYKKAKGIK